TTMTFLNWGPSGRSNRQYETKRIATNFGQEWPTDGSIVSVPTTRLTRAKSRKLASAIYGNRLRVCRAFKPCFLLSSLKGSSVGFPRRGWLRCWQRRQAGYSICFHAKG